MKQALVYLLVMCFFSLFSTSSFADDIELRYPELQVSPKASQRLLIEAKKEKNNHPNLKRYAPALTSAVFTLSSSFYLSSQVDSYGYNATKASDANKVASTGMLVGASWIGILSYMAYKESPYRDGFVEVSKLPEKTKAQKITKERLAEEKITAAADWSQKVAFLSAATNLLASTAVVAYAKSDVTLVAGLSALAAFAPYYFNNYWQSLSDRHQEYKKKIYGPVSMPMIYQNREGEVISGYQWDFRF
jgi:hypothetical protein